MLGTLDGWITGLRSDQTQNRQTSTKIEIDEQHDGMIKLNPILDWTWDQTMSYIKENDIPYNKLIDQGFPSIGCEPCTRAIKPVKIYEQVVGGGKTNPTKNVVYIWIIASNNFVSRYWSF